MRKCSSPDQKDAERDVSVQRDRGRGSGRLTVQRVCSTTSVTQEDVGQFSPGWKDLSRFGTVLQAGFVEVL